MLARESWILATRNPMLPRNLRHALPGDPELRPDGLVAVIGTGSDSMRDLLAASSTLLQVAHVRAHSCMSAPAGVEVACLWSGIRKSATG